MENLPRIKEDDPNAMLTPQQYFDLMKEKKNTVTSRDLKRYTTTAWNWQISIRLPVRSAD